MRIPAFLAILTISAMALAGCSGDGDGDGDSTTSSSSSSRSSTSATSTSGSSSSSSTSSSSTSTGPSNSPPTGSISVSVNGTNATFNMTGSDPDGDTFVWDLTFGDGNATNGTTLPANVTHQYSANLTGNLTINYTITDGQDSTTYNVTITLGGGSKDSLTIEGSSTGLDPTAGGAPMIRGCLFGDYADPSPGGHWHAIDANVDGWSWTLTAGYHAWFLDADGAALGDGTAAGTVPAGTAEVDICTSDPTKAPGGSYTFVATEP